ncbi:hypothetical protein [Actinomycetospora chiangmaiensis]|uniref:hypothetical protein n=1 Tax=Actinomycetospora chiangmaiensis TaxID=402650 RepID=UPI0003729AA5|nr:hypothetical protein [Actinomycetospora chiangmaiensis]
MVRKIIASRRWQWTGLGAALAFAVLRVVLAGSVCPETAILAASLVFGLLLIVLPAQDTRGAELWELCDAFKPLARADRRAVKRAVREQQHMPPGLLVAGETYARARVRNSERLPWTLAGFALLSTSSSWFPWTLLIVAFALVLGAVVVIRGSRWRRDHLSVVGRRRATVE